MKNFLIFISILIAAYVIYTKTIGNHFGVSAAAPLGKYQSVDDVLSSMSLKKESGQTAPVDQLAAFGATTQYSDNEDSSFLQAVYVTAAPDGSVQGIAATFISYREANSALPKKSKIQRFMEDYWKSTTGQEAAFGSYSGAYVSGQWYQAVPMEVVYLVRK